MDIQPYLMFEGRCEEAIEFYRKTLGAQVTFLLRVKDSPEPGPEHRLPPGSGDKVTHAAVRIGEAEIFLSDGLCSGTPRFEGFSLSLRVPTESEAERVFAALAEGGAVHQPLAKTFFSPRFGMLADRFGVPWMVIVPQ